MNQLLLPRRGWVKVGEDGWESDPPVLAKLLQVSIPVESVTPADGDPEHYLLREAQKRLGGELELDPVEEAEGRVY